MRAGYIQGDALRQARLPWATNRRRRITMQIRRDLTVALTLSIGRWVIMALVLMFLAVRRRWLAPRWYSSIARRRLGRRPEPGRPGCCAGA